MSRLSLHYADPTVGQSGFGWAVCNAELKRALRDHCALWMFSSPSEDSLGGVVGESCA